MSRHLNMYGKIVGLVRDEYLEVPAEALREAVLNALCHLHNSEQCKPLFGNQNLIIFGAM